MAQGSTGNVLAALGSLVIPGLGQLLQGRMIPAVVFFVVAVVVHVITFGLLGWVVHVIACIEAAVWKGPAST